MNLLAFLLAFFRPAVDGDDDGAADLNAGDGGDDKGDQGGDGADAGDDQGSDDKGDQGDDTAAQLAAERTARAEDRARADRFEREAEELRASQRRQPDPVVDEEERVLRDPQATDLQKWQVQANREIRAGRTSAQHALAQAQDLSDKTAFSNLAITKPDLHKRYATRVEEEYQKLRAKGQAAPREAILRFMIGDDAMKGELKKKPAAAKSEPNPNLNRGRMPGARSDVSGRNSMSERDKLRKRLDGVNI